MIKKNGLSSTMFSVIHCCMMVHGEMIIVVQLSNWIDIIDYSNFTLILFHKNIGINCCTSRLIVAKGYEMSALET